jgi:hypothetical protein
MSSEENANSSRGGAESAQLVHVEDLQVTVETLVQWALETRTDHVPETETQPAVGSGERVLNLCNSPERDDGVPRAGPQLISVYT